jgi:hypothetical protein
MTVVYDNPHRRRFITHSPLELGYDFLEYTVILSDITFWNEHYTDLRRWCQKYNSSVEGMVVTIPNAKTYSIFALRWA